jgi:hypothetical protein
MSSPVYTPGELPRVIQVRLCMRGSAYGAVESARCSLCLGLPDGEWKRTDYVRFTDVGTEESLARMFAQIGAHIILRHRDYILRG